MCRRLIKKISLEFNIDDYDGDGSSPYWFAHTRKSSHKLIRDLSLFQLTVPLSDEEKLFLNYLSISIDFVHGSIYNNN
ncbi:hypothetical protein DERP_012679 [Dermatophagoides pteronyssinus]|uniref:Uncharacterized protein n=1 Tax=Dermatophagoides pteronyssinus TaxID=6956 RepID=A0ABQ8IYJ7_DERPT|nr:hypothetical protein DERP_012679 [Dermatophagoides pteronyssinus]